MKEDNIPTWSVCVAVVLVLAAFVVSICTVDQQMNQYSLNLREKTKNAAMSKRDNPHINGYENLNEGEWYYYRDSLAESNKNNLKTAVEQVEGGNQLSYTDCMTLHFKKQSICGEDLIETYAFLRDGHKYDLYIASKQVSSGNRGYGYGYMSVVHSPKCPCQNSNDL